MKRFLLSFFILWLIILTNSLTTFAQNTTLDFSSNLSLKEKAWFFDYDNYICKDGKLYLNAKVKSNINRTIIIHKAKMSNRIQWQFSIFLPEKPNSRSKSYVLLAMLNDAKEKEREYLAIEFADIISICKIKHSKSTETQIHNLNRLKDFYFGIGEIPTRVDSENMELENLIFDIISDKEKGVYLNLYLGKKEKEYLIKSKHFADLKFDLARENWIGFAATYSKRLKNNFICNDFAIINSDSSQPLPKEFEDINEDDNNAEPKPDKDKNKDTNKDFDETDGNHIVINEIMANPSSDGVEFIELYNPLDKNLDLDNYFITYRSAGNAKSTTMSLEGLSIKAKSLILLTNNINKMFSKYSYLDADICYNLSFANMANTAFSLALSYKNKDNIFDKVDYSKDLIPKGFKSKKGISMQRISVSSNSNKQNWGFSNDKNYFDTAGKINKVEVLTNNKDKNTISPSEIANSDFIERAYKLAKDSKDLELDIFVYNTAGECIYYKSGSEAVQALDLIRSNSNGFYQNLQKYPYQILIFRFFFYKSKEGVQQITYKVLSPY